MASDLFSKGRKIGILGGTFDPIHYGHIYLAEAARDRFCLDLVYLMPTDDPYYKAASGISSFDDRFAMTKLAAEGRERLAASDFERRGDTDGYTVSTLRLYKKEFPEDEIHFIIGGDSLFTIENWKEIGRIFQMATILVSKRKDEAKGASGSLAVSSGLETLAETEDELDRQISYLREKYGAEIYNLYAPQFDVSSTALRQMIRDGESVSDFVPEKVAAFIRKRGLYTH